MTKVTIAGARAPAETAHLRDSIVRRLNNLRRISTKNNPKDLSF
jgi:hypothetical protein